MDASDATDRARRVAENDDWFNTELQPLHECSQACATGSVWLSSETTHVSGFRVPFPKHRAWKVRRMSGNECRMSCTTSIAIDCYCSAYSIYSNRVSWAFRLASSLLFSILWVLEREPSRRARTKRVQPSNRFKVPLSASSVPGGSMLQILG